MLTTNSREISDQAEWSLCIILYASTIRPIIQNLHIIIIHNIIYIIQAIETLL